MPARLVAALSCAFLVIVGCGGGDEAPPADTEAEAQATIEEFYEAVVAGDLPRHCELLTANGRGIYQRPDGTNLCDGTGSQVGAGSMPEIGPVGADQDVALAVIHYPAEASYPEQTFVSVLRRQTDGRWLVDLPQPVPVPPSLSSPQYPKAAIQKLPNAGTDADSVREVAESYSAAKAESDGATVCSLLTAEALERENQPDPILRKLPASAGATNCEKRNGAATSDPKLDVADVAVVGDVALAYQTAETGNSAQGSGPAGLESVLLLERTGDSWLVNPLVFGYG